MSEVALWWIIGIYLVFERYLIVRDLMGDEPVFKTKGEFLAHLLFPFVILVGLIFLMGNSVYKKYKELK